NGTPPCATIPPSGVTIVPPQTGGSPGVSITAPAEGGSISPSSAVSPTSESSINPSPSISAAPSGTPNSTPGTNVCSVNASQLINNVIKQNNSTVEKGGKTHIKCEPGQGNQGGGTSGGQLSQLFRLLLQLLLQLLQRIIGCLQQPSTGGTPIPSISPIQGSGSPSPSVSSSPSVNSPSPTTGNGNPTATPNPAQPTTPVTSSTCTNPTHVLPMNPSNPQDGITIGNFYVDTDTWNAANYQLTQTMYVCNYNNWYAVANMNDTGDGAVKTYPDVHEDFNGKPLSSFTTITSSYSHIAPTVGNYDFAYDIWVNGVATSGSTEVMIWTQALGKQADAINGYPSLGTVTLSGVTYNVHHNGNSYVALQMIPYKSSGTVDIKAIFNYLISKGIFPASSTLGAIDYGVEIVSTNGTNQTFTVNNFTLNAQ
ncbi:MAG TPA: hypothetical protein VNZ86_19655, partial [Bacteroidia bacterium]|nr:hypothetical protein [Bacteroidia bacterium]